MKPSLATAAIGASFAGNHGDGNWIKSRKPGRRQLAKSYAGVLDGGNWLHLIPARALFFPFSSPSTLLCSSSPLLLKFCSSLVLHLLLLLIYFLGFSFLSSPRPFCSSTFRFLVLVFFGFPTQVTLLAFKETFFFFCVSMQCYLKLMIGILTE